MLTFPPLIIIFINRKKKHTVIDFLFVLKNMNYITYIDIDYSVMTPIYVFYISLLHNRLSVQPKNHKVPCRINYIWFYGKNSFSLNFITCWIPQFIEAKVLSFNATGPQYQRKSSWSSFTMLFDYKIYISQFSIHTNHDDMWEELSFYFSGSYSTTRGGVNVISPSLMREKLGKRTH